MTVPGQTAVRVRRIRPTHVLGGIVLGLVLGLVSTLLALVTGWFALLIGPAVPMVLAVILSGRRSNLATGLLVGGILVPPVGYLLILALAEAIGSALRG